MASMACQVSSSNHKISSGCSALGMYWKILHSLKNMNMNLWSISWNPFILFPTFFHCLWLTFKNMQCISAKWRTYMEKWSAPLPVNAFSTNPTLCHIIKSMKHYWVYWERNWFLFTIVFSWSCLLRKSLC